VAFDDAGGLVVADHSNNRVQVFAGALAGAGGLPAAVRPLLADLAPPAQERVLADARAQAPLRVLRDVAATLRREEAAQAAARARREELREELRRLEEGLAARGERLADLQGRQQAAAAEFEGAVAAVLDAVAQEQRVVCDDCDNHDNHATHRCHDPKCLLNLCDGCCADHRRRKSTKHHALVSLDRSPPTSSASS